ncbi:hypothetical protein [Serratia bockelmannii]
MLLRISSRHYATRRRVAQHHARLVLAADIEGDNHTRQQQH